MRIAGLIVAAGAGSRAGSTLPKQYLPLLGATILRHAAATLQRHCTDGRILLVIDPEYRTAAEEALSGLSGMQFAAGGATRTQSVLRGLEALAADPPDIVLIHDAARPGLPPSVALALVEAIAKGADGAAPVLPVADALKRVGADGAILGQSPREGVARVQTPQAFRFAAILQAYRIHAGGAAVDDDLAIAAMAELKLRTVPGAHSLMKATYPDDFAALEALMSASLTPRIGSGFDVHRFGPGDHVMLCGVRVALDRGLIGHSDADVAWHALTDALLGAAALGDIGDHFPPSDPRWKGADSALFLRHAAELVRAGGARIANVDLTIIGEKPKVKPHRLAMREATAAVLRLPMEAVSVKATTTEKLGFTGREEGLAAQAVAMILSPSVCAEAKDPAG
jgi:2-C-methyl-D-erythritol 4-phosphate cytidylyltransferase / 2-C-methyl-D-erythritol 2,4-cyclodiphosphate synthase